MIESKPSDFFTNVSEFDFEIEKRKLISSLNKIKSMSVQEATFYKKWEELQQYKNTNIGSKSIVTKRRIWDINDITDQTSTINQIESLNPEVLFVDESDDQLFLDWNNLRLFCHTMEFNQNPGRFLRFIIRDSITKKYLGILSVASDVILISDRDKYIGWTQEDRLTNKRLGNSAIGSCIMATQPFGYNFLGGKLMACLTTSKVIRDKWEELYKQKLVGMTTTSLYGSYSMYNNIKWWHKCGTSTGKILIKPDQSCYDIWHEWIKKNRKDDYEKAMKQKDGVSGPVTAAKLRVLSMIMDACDIKQKNFVHGYERGVYFSLLYENSKEFFQCKISEDKLKIKPMIEGDVKSILEWWRPKAIDRYKRLFIENKLKTDMLYYDLMIDMSYEDAKKRYFSDVGVGK
jgi:hypothetical protein